MLRRRLALCLHDHRTYRAGRGNLIRETGKTSASVLHHLEEFDVEYLDGEAIGLNHLVDGEPRNRVGVDHVVGVVSHQHNLGRPHAARERPVRWCRPRSGDAVRSLAVSRASPVQAGDHRI